MRKFRRAGSAQPTAAKVIPESRPGSPLPKQATKAEAAQASHETAQDRQDHLEQLREQAAETGNPMFVWLAIEHCYRGAIQDAIDDASSAEAAATAVGKAAPKVLPDWVMRYLGHTAHRLVDLAYGRDFRTFHKIPSGDFSQAQRAAFLAWWAGTLTAEKAMQAVPAALGLTSRGYSAFSSFVSAENAKGVAFMMRHLRGTGLSLDEAAARIAEQRGYEDSRSVLRLAQKGRRRKVAKPQG